MYLLLLAACFSMAYANLPAVDFNCTGQPDDLAWWGCRSYGVCQNEEHTQFDCLNGTVYDQNSQDCVNMQFATFPCNLDRSAECAALNDTVHRLPELEAGDNAGPCQYYYTCVYGQFVGHQSCPPGTEYFESEQNCYTLDTRESECF